MTGRVFEDHIDQVEFLVRKVAWVVKKRGRDILKNFDITPPQFNALLVIRHGDLTMGELCSKLFLASSTVTDLVDRMEANDLVRRHRDTHDRRVVRIAIEDKGQELIGAVMQARKDYLSHILADMDQDQLDEVVEALGAIHVRMMEHDIHCTDADHADADASKEKQAPVGRS